MHSDGWSLGLSDLYYQTNMSFPCREWEGIVEVTGNRGTDLPTTQIPALKLLPTLGANECVLMKDGWFFHIYIYIYLSN